MGFFRWGTDTYWPFWPGSSHPAQLAGISEEPWVAEGAACPIASEVRRAYRSLVRVERSPRIPSKLLPDESRSAGHRVRKLPPKRQ
jgi:hypothetical protein